MLSIFCLATRRYGTELNLFGAVGKEPPMKERTNVEAVGRKTQLPFSDNCRTPIDQVEGFTSCSN